MGEALLYDSWAGSHTQTASMHTHAPAGRLTHIKVYNQTGFIQNEAVDAAGAKGYFYTPSFRHFERSI